jgi:hypothetical protein
MMPSGRGVAGDDRGGLEDIEQNCENQDSAHDRKRATVENAT